MGRDYLSSSSSWQPRLVDDRRNRDATLVRLTDGGTSTDGREEHPTKTFWWIDVTDDGMVTDVREEQPWKAYSPIDVTDDGMVTDVREEQRQKA